ncbi:BTAD domain-containing putative transcriptional regulator [Catellatospora sp. KI3]|uniref:AfsR/SARP family transcriptional regulator n=1 Tax=Catellatospora sp. KI3 TaxID=3041620 RepID=UPI0024823DAE|nr:AfsR/SARP family transcriptional regulator [Catellatospora sp. KI3]MDI1464758.1 BTAD domain-containing putative transcriptional regulator [Catellatospora sp. KI3]
MGPVEAWADGRAVPLGGAKPRALLAALALELDRVVPVNRLIDLVWAEDPPDTARALIQTYVKNLRRAFADVGEPEVIATVAPGYALRIAAGAIDAHAFSTLLEQARQAPPAEAVELLGRAEALWRGPALAGLEDTRLSGEAVRLDELRLTAVEERIAAELSLGRHGHLSELTGLVGRHPVNERLRGHLMVSLYRMGRQADALASFRECRDLLIEELGVEPGAELTALHSAILRGSLTTADSASATVRVPAQLPPVPADFTGRAAESAALTGGTHPVRVISGQGGSGKSALLAIAARELAPAYPDGTLHADLHGMSDAPAAAAEIQARFLRAVGVADEHLPVGAEERTQLYRSTLVGRRMLVLLDDARNAAQVRPLLPGTADCVVLITSRDRLAGLDGAQRIELGVLPDGEAAELLRRVVGAERVDGDPAAARRIIAHCGNLPLAIRLAGAKLVSRQRWPLSVLADRLGDESRRLSELSTQELCVRASIELSCQGLDPHELMMLRRLGYLGLPDFSAWVAGWLLDRDKADADALIESLVDGQLVEYVGVDAFGSLRYRMHDLVRLYARERAQREEPHADLVASVARTLGGWLTLIDNLGAESPPEDVNWRYTLSNVYRPSEQMAARTSTDPGNWFAAEQQSLTAGVERAAALGLHELVCELASARFAAVTSGTNRFEVTSRINQAALAAVRAAGDVRREGVMLAELGKLRYYQDQYAEARTFYNEALTKFREVGDVQGQAAALAGLGTACREPGHLVEALHFLSQADTLLRELGDPAGLGYVLRLTGSVQLELGDYPAAAHSLAESLAAYRATGSIRGEGYTLRTLGLYHRARGDYEPAIEACEQAREIFRKVGDELMEAYATRSLAKACLRIGRTDQVVEQLEWSLSTSHSLGDRFGQAVTLRTLGDAHLRLDRADLAGNFLRASLELFESFESPLWAARVRRDLSALHSARGEHEQAALLRADALRVFHDHGAREHAELLGG